MAVHSHCRRVGSSRSRTPCTSHASGPSPPPAAVPIAAAVAASPPEAVEKKPCAPAPTTQQFAAHASTAATKTAHRSPPTVGRRPAPTIASAKRSPRVFSCAAMRVVGLDGWAEGLSKEPASYRRVRAPERRLRAPAARGAPASQPSEGTAGAPQDSPRGPEGARGGAPHRRAARRWVCGGARSPAVPPLSGCWRRALGSQAGAERTVDIDSQAAEDPTHRIATSDGPRD